MSKKNTISINALLNVIRVGMSILFPLITFPYASRILQVENLGKVNYSQSIVSYFALLAALGVTNYAVREGAKLRNDKNAITAFSSQILSVNLVTTFFSYILLFASLIVFPKFHLYSTVILVQSISILFATIGVEWLNTVFDDYYFITIRSIIIHVFSLICLFIFVHTPNDYILYACLSVISNGLICVMNLFHCRKKVPFRPVLKMNFFKHIKPMLVFFSNNLAITIYVSSDMIMLGWVVGDHFTGLYSVSVKIYQIVKQLLVAIYVVTIPRLSTMASINDNKNFKKLITGICSVLTLLVMPASMEIIVLSNNIILLLSGEEYLEAAFSLQILAVTLVFALAGGVLVNCINTPLGREKISLKATTVAAISNVVLNCFFIPEFQHNGAAITTAISEFIVCSICIVKMSNIGDVIDLHHYIKQLIYALVGATWIFIVNLFVSFFEVTNIFHIFCVMFLGCSGYLFLLIIGKNEYTKSLLNKLKTKKQN